MIDQQRALFDQADLVPAERAQQGCGWVLGDEFASVRSASARGSRPGAGPKLAPRLLGELGSVREIFPDADSLCCQSGTSPVRYQSGQINKARIRWACGTVLRHTVHLWADCSRKKSAWAQACYRKKREQGMSHAAALRCLGKRWLKVLWRMWQDRQPYQESLHEQSLRDHGSWVIARMNSNTNPAAPSL